jgi:hypothetical protein
VREIWKPRDDEPGDQVKARKGDAIITHHLLRHGTARNLTNTIRYMAFFRCLPHGWRSRFGSNEAWRDNAYAEEMWQFSRGWAS